MTTESPEDAAFKADLLEQIPSLRAFARTLSGNMDAADDLAQETLVKAWRARATFAPGTNFKAWLFTILRNQFYSEKRRGWRDAPWDQSAAERVAAPADEQDWAMELAAVAGALRRLSDDQREALILVGAGGFSYEDVSRICNCAVGTVKSRVARARQALIAILENNEGVAPVPEKDAANEILTQLDELARKNA